MSRARKDRFIIMAASVLFLSMVAFFVHEKFEATRDQELTWFRVAASDFKKANQLEQVTTPGGVIAFRVQLHAQGVEATRPNVFDLKHCLPSEEKIERNPPAGSAYSSAPVCIKEALS